MTKLDTEATPVSGQRLLGYSDLLGAFDFEVTRSTKRRVYGIKSWTDREGHGSEFPTSMTRRQFETLASS